LLREPDALFSCQGHFMETGDRKYLAIGELARLVEMSPRTIRYYEEIGLLNSVKRVEGGKRVYTERDFQRIRFIKRLKHLGFTLSEMHELENVYKIHRTNRKVLSRLLELLDNHAQKIDERINNLTRLKDDIISYRENIRLKISADGNSQKERI